VVLCDAGHEMLEIAILEEKNIYFARCTSGGGKKFNVALDKILQTGTERATIFKHERSRIYHEGTPVRTKQDEAFQPALREGADLIASAIRSSVMFCRTQAKLPKLDFNRVFLSGGGARVKGLCEYLEKKLARPVQPLNIATNVNLGKLPPESAQLFQHAISDMTVALGLAVIDAKPKVFHFRLVPEAILAKRAFWRKTMLGIAAGVLVILGLIPPYLNAQKASAASAAVVSEFESRNQQALKEKKDFLKLTEEKKVFAATVDYYARQTRIGRVYVELFRAIRASTPDHVMLTYVGFGTSDANSTASPGLGGWSGVDEPIRDIVIKGEYDKAAYPEQSTHTINDAWRDGMRKELLKVPGVVRAELSALTDLDPANLLVMEKRGQKPFQATIRLQDLSQPLKVVGDGAEPTKAKPQ
jgi:hypothetical protein